jgi:hypothetical protein
MELVKVAVRAKRRTAPLGYAAASPAE